MTWDRHVNTHHTDFSLLAGAGGADQGFQLISDALVIIQDLSQLLYKVLSLARVWQVPCRQRIIRWFPQSINLKQGWLAHSVSAISEEMLLFFSPSTLSTNLTYVRCLTCDHHDFGEDSLAWCFRLQQIRQKQLGNTRQGYILRIWTISFLKWASVGVTLGFLIKSSRSLTWCLSRFWHFHISFKALRGTEEKNYQGPPSQHSFNKSHSWQLCLYLLC